MGKTEKLKSVLEKACFNRKKKILYWNTTKKINLTRIDPVNRVLTQK